MQWQCASQNWDYIIPDTEHNDYNLETLSNCCVGARYEEMKLFVRVPYKLYYQMAQTLDIGAEGLVLPQVRTGEEAQHIIHANKYSPVGSRGVSIPETLTLFKS